MFHGINAHVVCQSYTEENESDLMGFVAIKIHSFSYRTDVVLPRLAPNNYTTLQADFIYILS